MTLFIKSIAFILTIALSLIWLLFCLCIALMGSLFSKKEIQIDLEEVYQKETVCSVLHKKGFLSDEEYYFETNNVAKQYNQTTFRGYLFIVAPLIVLLQYTNFADSLIKKIVSIWMDVHHFQKSSDYTAKRAWRYLVLFCVRIAEYVGRFLTLFTK